MGLCSPIWCRSLNPTLTTSPDKIAPPKKIAPGKCVQSPISRPRNFQFCRNLVHMSCPYACVLYVLTSAILGSFCRPSNSPVAGRAGRRQPVHRCKHATASGRISNFLSIIISRQNRSNILCIIFQ